MFYQNECKYSLPCILNKIFVDVNQMINGPYKYLLAFGFAVEVVAKTMFGIFLRICKTEY